jgi:hypothetical protein
MFFWRHLAPLAIPELRDFSAMFPASRRPSTKTEVLGTTQSG